MRNQPSSAHAFYAHMGALPVAEIEVHKGAVSAVYVHALNGERSAGAQSDGANLVETARMIR